jgi:hypothetical protein
MISCYASLEVSVFEMRLMVGLESSMAASTSLARHNPQRVAHA